MASSALSKEIAAMSAIEKGLDGLESGELERVLRWACDRFGVAMTKPAAANAGKGAAAAINPEQPIDESETLAEFFGRADPKTEANKALVVAYWSQYRENNPTFEAAKINLELKNLGHHVGNITTAFNALKATKPNLVVQLQKSGTSKQARKTYKVTVAGKNAVEKMLSGAGDSEE